jgi:hypothetical protein
MASQLIATNERLRAVRPALLWGLAAFVAFVMVYLIAGRVERMVANWPHSRPAGISPTHCAEFIELAKLAYGTTWKARLDPSDTTCANEIQQAWEQQRISRDAEAEALRAQQSEPPAIAPPAPPPTVPLEARPARAETYCLNVISLAKAKYGPDWMSKLDPAERAACVRP